MNYEGRNLLVALVAAIISAFLMYSYSQEKKAQIERELGAKRTVVVAKKKILEFQTIDDDMVELLEVPDRFIQPGAVTNPESIVGFVAAAPIEKGEQILFNKLLQPGAETGLAMQVSPSKRAVTVPIDEVRAVGKLIRPGDRVDVLVALDIGKGLNAKREVITLLTDVPVLATGVNVTGGLPRVIEYDAASKSLIQTNLTADTKYNTVTLEVSPKEAQDLVYILSTSPSSIFLTLRNPNEKGILPRMPSSSAENISLQFGVTGSSSNMPQIQIPNSLNR